MCSLDGRAIWQRQAGQPLKSRKQRIDQLHDRHDAMGDRGRVPVHVGGDQVDVDQKQLLELRVFLTAEVIAAEDASQVGIKVPDAVGEQALVPEHRGDLAGQSFGVNRIGVQQRQDAVEGLDDLAEQLTGHFPGTVSCVQDGDRLPVHAPAELGDLVAGPGTDVLGDRADLRVADGRREVAPFDQLPAACFSRITADDPVALGELCGDFGRRKISKQRGREQIHDRQVVGGLVSRQVVEQAATTVDRRR